MKNVWIGISGMLLDIVSLSTAIEVVQIIGGISSFVVSAIGIYRSIRDEIKKYKQKEDD